MPNDPIFQFYEEQLDDTVLNTDVTCGFFPLTDSGLTFKTVTIGTAQAGGGTTAAKFPTTSPGITDYYTGCWITFSDAPTTIHTITAYNQTTKLATFIPARGSAPDGFTIYLGGHFASRATERAACFELGGNYYTNTGHANYKTGAIAGISAGAGDAININKVAHGLSTGALVRFSGVTGTVSTTLNDKTFQVTSVDADNFTLDSTTLGALTGSGGNFYSVGFLLNDSPTNTEAGPFSAMPDGVSGALYFDGTMGGIDFGTATDGTCALAKRIVLGGSNTGLYGGVWFKLSAYPAAGTTQHLVCAPNNATGPKYAVEVTVREAGGVYYLDFITCPAATGTTFTATLGGAGGSAILSTLDDWYFVGWAMRCFSNINASVFLYSVTDGWKTAETTLPSGVSMVVSTTTNYKSTLGYRYRASTPENFFKGYMAGFFMTAVSTQSTTWVVDPTYLFTNFALMALGQIPPGRRAASLRTLFSPQNLRI